MRPGGWRLCPGLAGRRWARLGFRAARHRLPPGGQPSSLAFSSAGEGAPASRGDPPPPGQSQPGRPALALPCPPRSVRRSEERTARSAAGREAAGASRAVGAPRGPGIASAASRALPGERLREPPGRGRDASRRGSGRDEEAAARTEGELCPGPPPAPTEEEEIAGARGRRGSLAGACRARPACRRGPAFPMGGGLR